MDMLDQLAAKASLAPETARALTEALRRCLVDASAAGEDIAVPMAGTFATLKECERVDTDISTGRKVMLPPSLSLVFRPGAAMRNLLKKQ